MLKRTPLKRKTPLRAKYPLNAVSEARLEEIKAEVPIRIALAERCGGKPYLYTVKVVIRHKHSIRTEVLTGVRCLGGTCEICGLPAALDGGFLEPHEEPFRSHGGKVSLQDSKMAHRSCHNNRHGRQ